MGTDITFSAHNTPAIVAHLIVRLSRDGDYELAEAVRLANRVDRPNDSRRLIIDAHEPDRELLGANFELLSQHLARIDGAGWFVDVKPVDTEIGEFVLRLNQVLTEQGLPTVIDVKVRQRDHQSTQNVAVIADDTPEDLVRAIDGVMFQIGTRRTAISLVPPRRLTPYDPTPPADRKLVFISYGSADRKYVDELVAHLGRLRHDGILAWEFNRHLDGGDEHDPQIRAALARADAAIVLVSQHWFASDYINEVEAPALADGMVPVYPVFARTCDWAGHPIAVNWATTGTIPLEQLDEAERNEVYARLAQDLRERFAV